MIAKQKSDNFQGAIAKIIFVEWLIEIVYLANLRHRLLIYFRVL